MEIDQDTPRMTPEELRQAGEILYGTHWQSELARAIGVDPRRVRQSINGERPIPTSLRSEIILLLKEKSIKSVEYADYLDQQF
ncbi:transcriptional regulator [Acinetobacter baumannii]|uniref:transcriptional regulator n=1 Tax=Acinetobacter baumannii TaxID=470 RepID=UPI000BE46C85|nr:transcriptional regulator [Acinetobacter baumannii]ATI40423.1 transcriptional regulator [Acinetobacter baumannii]MBF9260698.1 transcriptional regulator [Acinetobacter baumannii]MCJ8917345.1 helix-turn-helix domain-containing protein [Acinetobacter baumannii]MCJ9200942.1 helix-turn-helix domain-containing protein [Acinetobacter baumannii]MDC4456024.1 helix-turn-helix domain-containing protein [Acinetobacter baumannii]